MKAKEAGEHIIVYRKTFIGIFTSECVFVKAKHNRDANCTERMRPVQISKEIFWYKLSVW